MSNGDGPAAGDLGLEDGDDAARAAEDIAEANGSEPVGRDLGPRTDEQLPDSLGGAHDARGIDRLVARDQDEPLAAAVLGHVQDVAAADHVVLHRLLGGPLHEGDVFVGGGMEDVLGVVLLPDLLQPLGITDVHHLGREQQVRPGLPELSVEEVELVLVDVRQDQTGRPMGGNLAADLAADRPRGSGDQDPPALHQGPHLAPVEAGLAARQEVLGGKGLKQGGAGLIAQVGKGDGQGLVVELVLRAQAQHVTNEGGGRTGDGEEKLTHLAAEHDGGQIVDPAQHQPPPDRAAPLGAVVVHETQHFVGMLVRPPQVAQKQLARTARPHDDGPHSFSRPCDPLLVQPGQGEAG